MFLNYLYLVTLMNFEGVLCIYVLLHYEGQAEYHSHYVFYMWKKPTSFNALLFMMFVCILSCCSIVTILSSMCIVPKLIDWFILLIFLVLELFISSHSYELWRCPMHLFDTPWGKSWMPLCYVFYMWNKQTSCKALLFMNLLFVPFLVTT